MDLKLEKKLVERTRRGDMTAFEQLYRAHKDALLHRIILPRVPTPADAEDVLVDTFVTAVERIDRFKWQGRSFYFWLARIASNKAHDTGRRKGRDERARDALSVEPTPVEALPVDHVIARADRMSAQERVEQVLEIMNPRYAKALRLRLLEERSRQDCAELMDVKLGTFDVLLLRAVRAFRKSWTKLFGQGEVI